jgi:hypothetical protein
MAVILPLGRRALRFRALSTAPGHALGELLPTIACGQWALRRAEERRAPRLLVGGRQAGNPVSGVLLMTNGEWTYMLALRAKEDAKGFQTGRQGRRMHQQAFAVPATGAVHAMIRAVQAHSETSWLCDDA